MTPRLAPRMRSLLALLAILALLAAPAAAKPRAGTLYMGLGGLAFAGPLFALKAELERRGARVAVLPWWLPIGGGGDFAAGQSMGVAAANAARAPCRVGIDPVATDFARIGVNFWTRPRPGYPAGRPLTRARNIRVDAATHVSLPRVAKRRIAAVTMGDCR